MENAINIPTTHSIVIGEEGHWFVRTEGNFSKFTYRDPNETDYKFFFSKKMLTGFNNEQTTPWTIDKE